MIESVTKLSTGLRDKRRAIPSPPPPGEEPDAEAITLDVDIKKMTVAKIDRIRTDVDSMLDPFFPYNTERANEVVATMMDLLLVGGKISVDANAAKLGDQAHAIRIATGLINQYHDKLTS
eukprot:jgi/Tetstr1/461527/TSEL_006633.t1